MDQGLQTQYNLSISKKYHKIRGIVKLISSGVMTMLEWLFTLTALGASHMSSAKTTRQAPLPTQVLLHVASQSQLPQLPNGCEVTSLSMLLTAVGHPIDKMTLAREMPKDPTREVIGKNGNIVYWGNPNTGFVGSVYRHPSGYAIYHGPLGRFLNRLLPNRAVDLTGKPFEDILRYVADGTPVEVWTTATVQPTTLWQTWQSPTGPVHATMEEHAVLLVGYNATTLFINNPLNGRQAQPVNRRLFIEAWKQLGEQALTVRSRG